MLHPVAAAQRALVAHLEAALPALHVAEGWPEADTVPQLPELTVVRVGSPQYDLHAPAEKAFADGLATYRYGLLRFNVQLDLWTEYRAQRDELAHTVEQALNPDLPSGTGLWLSSADYHGRPLSFDLAEGEPMDDAMSAGDGLWRFRWVLGCTTDLVVEVAMPTLGRVDIQLVTEAAGRQLEELRIVVPS